MVPLRLVTRGTWLESFVLRTKPPDPGLFSRVLYKKSKIQLLKKSYASYEGDGKTVGFVINKKGANNLLVTHVKTEGFIMAGDSEIIGAMILFPHSIISWNVTKAEDVNEDSLTLFKLLDPKLDILVFGYGNREDYTPEIRQNFTQICRKMGLRFEALPTIQAVGLFNFLAEERRFVAAALIPPTVTDKLLWDRSKDLLLEDDSEELETLPGDTQEKKLLK